MMAPELPADVVTIAVAMIRRLHKGLDIPAEILIEEIEITA